MADQFAVRNLVTSYAPGPAKPAFPRTAGFVPASRVGAYSSSTLFGAQRGTGAAEAGGNVLLFPAPFSRAQDSGPLSNALLAQLFSQQRPPENRPDRPPAPAYNTLAQNAYRRSPGATFIPPHDVDIPPVGPHRENLPAVDFLV